MSKKRAFVRYTKAGKIVPGSLVVTDGSYPQGPAKWSEVPADLCCTPENPCTPQDYGEWRLVTGGEAGDGVVLVDEQAPNNFTIIGPNDDVDTGWVYLKRYFPEGTCLDIDYEWASFDGGTDYDKPVYWTSSTEPTGIPDDLTPQVGSTPEDGTWNIIVDPGLWFAIGIYSTDSCCGRGFLQIEIDEVPCP